MSPLPRVPSFLFAALLLALSWPAVHAIDYGRAMIWENPHHELVEAYDGTGTCLECHEDSAREVHGSIHYQWKADAPNISNSAGKPLGKLNTINDFCTNPAISWIGILKNDRGDLIGNGCSACHVGLGAKPTGEPTRAQLENIDCLICHSANYRREVVKREGASLAWQPVAAAEPALMLNLARNVTKPTTEVCLRCHVGAGGGFNFKRGDLETAHASADRDFDVHMGSGMQCIQCHRFKGHRVAGTGTQFAGVDVPVTEKPHCESCHHGAVHDDARLNRHAVRVFCTTCHIPTFARNDPTDVHRDWSETRHHEGKGKFGPATEFASDVRPAYAWWNGKGKLALLGEPVDAGENGRVTLYAPIGSVDDPQSKLHAFKYHTAVLPVDRETRRLIPIKVGIAFKTGDSAKAASVGAAAWYGEENIEIDWVDTERYMGIFHEVVPATDALACDDCHASGGRMNWKSLGYAGDPAGTRSGSD